MWFKTRCSVGVKHNSESQNSFKPQSHGEGWLKRVPRSSACWLPFEAISVKLLLSGGRELFPCELLETHACRRSPKTTVGLKSYKDCRARRLKTPHCGKGWIETGRKGHMNGVCSAPKKDICGQDCSKKCSNFEPFGCSLQQGPSHHFPAIYTGHRNCSREASSSITVIRGE